MTYRAPVDDIMFALKTAVDLPQLIERGIYEGLDGAEVVALGTRPFLWTTTVVADLDQDGCQEVLVGAEVYDCAGAPKCSSTRPPWSTRPRSPS